MSTLGLLVHITSLPDKHGFGTLGLYARSIPSKLANAGFHVWEMLPLYPPDMFGSPYNAKSAFALSPLIMDTDYLRACNLLHDCHIPPAKTFAEAAEQKALIMRIAFSRAAVFRSAHKREINQFIEKNEYWLHNYCLYAALRAYFKAPWYEWDETYNSPSAVGTVRYERHNRDVISQYILEQFLLQRQYDDVKACAKAVGVKLMGDLPFYVARDSADVWANRELFDMSEMGGVPPDDFSKNGQVWNCPIIRFDVALDWLRERVSCACQRFDILRLDHFRGYQAYYAIQAGETMAKNARLVMQADNGHAILDAIKSASGDTELVAEDLGITDDAVGGIGDLARYAGCLVTRVMQFGDMPGDVAQNCAYYIGTHDNDTLVGYILAMGNAERAAFAKSVGVCSALKPEEMAMSAIECAIPQCKAKYLILTAQDIMLMGSKYRMNTPGRAEGNWAFQMTEKQFDSLLS